jgi:hypothetical protein
LFQIRLGHAYVFSERLEYDTCENGVLRVAARGHETGYQEKQRII